MDGRAGGRTVPAAGGGPVERPLIATRVMAAIELQPPHEELPRGLQPL
jgi:hypothetical protein